MSAKDVAVMVVALVVVGTMSGCSKKQHHDSSPTDALSSFVLDTSVPSDDVLPSDDAGSVSGLNMPCSTYVLLSGGDRLTEADAYLEGYGDGSYATTANARDVRSIFDVTCKSYPDENTDDAFDLAKLGLS